MIDDFTTGPYTLDATFPAQKLIDGQSGTGILGGSRETVLNVLPDPTPANPTHISLGTGVLNVRLGAGASGHSASASITVSYPSIAPFNPPKDFYSPDPASGVRFDRFRVRFLSNDSTLFVEVLLYDKETFPDFYSCRMTLRPNTSPVYQDFMLSQFTPYPPNRSGTLDLAAIVAITIQLGDGGLPGFPGPFSGKNYSIGSFELFGQGPS